LPFEAAVPGWKSWQERLGLEGRPSSPWNSSLQGRPGHSLCSLAFLVCRD
jgi:hypothetical protein